MRAVRYVHRPLPARGSGLIDKLPDGEVPRGDPDSSGAATRQFCTFFLDGVWFGIEVQHVQEVLRHQAMTRVPLAPPVISGLINLRGQIVTAIDLRLRMGRPPLPPEAPRMNIVVRSDDAPVSLLVDEVGDVLAVPEEAFEGPPDTLRGAARELIKGTYKLKDRLLLVLDPDKAVEGDRCARS